MCCAVIEVPSHLAGLFLHTREAQGADLINILSPYHFFILLNQVISFVVILISHLIVIGCLSILCIPGYCGFFCWFVCLTIFL